MYQLYTYGYYKGQQKLVHKQKEKIKTAIIRQSLALKVKGYELMSLYFRYSYI